MAWDNGMIGRQFQNPFNDREFVTVTGYDSVKNQVQFKDQRGTQGRIGGGSINVESLGKSNSNVSATKRTVTPSRSGGVVDQPLDRAFNASSLSPGTLSSDAGVISSASQKEQKAAPSEPIGSKENPVVTESQYSTEYKASMGALAGAKFLVDVINANSAYNTVKGQAQLNIIQARNQGADTLFRGRQARLDAESQGYQVGQQALLNAAAQGQDVQGAGTQKIQGSYEALGIINGMKEEINSMRESLGYDLEEINYEYQMDNAAIERDNAILGSGLNFAASAASIGAM